MRNAIFTVTLNAAIDQTYVMDRLTMGDVNRVKRMISQAGGKGNNVARTVHRLGGDVTACGWVAGHNGRRLVELLRCEGIHESFLEVAQGETRCCLTVLESDLDRTTEILEPGLHVTPSDLAIMKTHLAGMVQPGDYVILSGSLPRGCTVSDFKGIADVVAQRGAYVVIDTSGPALAEAVTWSPFMVKPNENEAAELMTSSIDANGPPPIERQLQILVDMGVARPVITLGDKGAVLYGEGTFYRAVAPAIRSLNAVGSGDAFLGGLIWGLSRGETTERALAVAVAAGADNASRLSAGQIDPSKVYELADRVLLDRS